MPVWHLTSDINSLRFLADYFAADCSTADWRSHFWQFPPSKRRTKALVYYYVVRKKRTQQVMMQSEIGLQIGLSHRTQQKAYKMIFSQLKNIWICRRKIHTLKMHMQYNQAISGFLCRLIKKEYWSLTSAFWPFCKLLTFYYVFRVAQWCGGQRCRLWSSPDHNTRVAQRLNQVSPNISWLNHGPVRNVAEMFKMRKL